MYTLNGLGKNGSIPGGSRRSERRLLLRREALELALYTFRYAEDVDMVVTLLPPLARRRPARTSRPRPAAAGAGAVLPARRPARRARRAARRDGPAADAAAREARPRRARGASGIDALTRANLFTATFQQGQDASVFLVLDR